MPAKWQVVCMSAFELDIGDIDGTLDAARDVSVPCGNLMQIFTRTPGTSADGSNG